MVCIFVSPNLAVPRRCRRSFCSAHQGTSRSFTFCFQKRDGSLPNPVMPSMPFDVIHIGPFFDGQRLTCYTLHSSKPTDHRRHVLSFFARWIWVEEDSSFVLIQQQSTNYKLNRPDYLEVYLNDFVIGDHHCCYIHVAPLETAK